MRILGTIIHYFFPLGLIAAFGTMLVSSISPDQSPRVEGFGIEMSALPALSAQNTEQLMEMISSTGAEYIRQEVNWSAIETSQDVYDWSAAEPLDLLFAAANIQNIKVVAVLTGGPVYLAMAGQLVDSTLLGERWENFVQAAVDHFGETVNIWEIGSDINGLYGMSPFFYPLSPEEATTPDPAYYSKLLRSASKIIKDTDANDEVWMGSLVSLAGKECAVNPLTFLLEINASKGWKSMDAITFHPRHGASAPEFKATGAPAGLCSSNLMTTPTSLSAEINALQELARQLGGKTVVITGLGWSQSNLETLNSGRSISTTQLEADLVSRASAALLSGNAVPLVFWNMDIVNNPNGRNALINMVEAIDKGKPLGQIQGQTGAVHEYRFRKAGEVIAIAWRSSEGDTAYPVNLDATDISSYKAFGVDSDSLNNENGVEIMSDSFGMATVLLNERPVIFIGRSRDITANLKAAIEDQFEIWQYELTKIGQSWMNDLKASFMRMLENWFKQVKENAVEWGEEKLDELLP